MGCRAVRLLILSFYYRPDLSAGSFRVTALAGALRERAPAGTQIDVVTTLPNRYHSFAAEAAELEREPGWELRRLPLPAHHNDMAGQVRAFGEFARAARAHVAGRHYDLVFATSSRLMTAALGAWFARRNRGHLYLDLRDIFVDTIGELLPAPAAWCVRPGLERLESWTVRRADRVNLVSPGFADYFRSRYGEVPLSFFTNGIDSEFLQPPAAGAVARDPDGRMRIVYAGNIGDGQALHAILPGLAVALRDRARMIIIGDGGQRRRLEAAVGAAGAGNVEFRAPMRRAELIEVYRSAHVLFLHLGNLPAFEKVLPSKLFEYAALGKPVLAGVAGYAARFVREEIDNSAVFAPGDVAGALRALDSLELSDRARPRFVARYARANIVAAMADEILSVGQGT
jgi:glycosyltransferase involved in cell wall biosynthesis